MVSFSIPTLHCMAYFKVQKKEAHGGWCLFKGVWKWKIDLLCASLELGNLHYDSDVLCNWCKSFHSILRLKSIFIWSATTVINYIPFVSGGLKLCKGLVRSDRLTFWPGLGSIWIDMNNDFNTAPLKTAQFMKCSF